MSTTTKAPAESVRSGNGAISAFEPRQRRGRRARLYAMAGAGVASLALLVVLVAANVRSVELDWIFGSARVSLAVVVLAATVLGWLIGIATAAAFRHRTKS
jgi:uncharacterized integral membrane protein